MKRISPDFYDQFHCIAGNCSDTCCAGWEIDVDADSMARYNALTGSFGTYIRSNIDTSDDCCSFHLKENDRCPFLNDDNLCEMILRGGDDLLCEICSEHPRFYEWYGDYEERGIGLCCEVACRLLLDRDTPLKFLIDTDNTAQDTEGDSFFALRESMFRIVFDTQRSPADCASTLLDHAQRTQEALYGTTDALASPTITESSSYYPWLLSELAQLEPLNDEWTATLLHLTQQLPALLAQTPDDIRRATLSDIQWRNTLCYILYRHLPKVQWDGLLFARTAFALHCIEVINLLNRMYFLDHGEISLLTHIENVKLWSKQVEYCCENTDLFICHSID